MLRWFVKLYNVNGLSIKQVVGESISQRKGNARNELNTRSISSLQFVQEDKILLTSSFDSTINVYDEVNIETTFRLRRLEGGHLNAAITCMSYSEHLSLIATGSMDGQITVWDYEMSRIEGICLKHAREILTLSFLDSYPLLLSSSMDGIMCLWRVRDLHYVCLASLLNVHIEYFGLPSLCATSALVFHGEKVSKQKNQYAQMTEKELKSIYSKSIGSKKFIDLKKTCNFSKSSERVYIIIGDEKGGVRILNSKKVARFLSIRPVKKHRNNKSFNPRRKENCNVSLIVTSELSK
jgi:WD40 repeat protein